MTLVSILGDFHSSILPVTFEFKDQISKHIIVHDDAHYEQKEALRVIKGQKDFLQDLTEAGKANYDIETIRIEEDNYANLLGCVERIKHAADEYGNIYLNATDGLSSIAIVLSSNLLALGAKVIAYDRYANTYNLHTSNGMDKQSIEHNMDIKSHLLLKGYTLLSVTERKDLLERKDAILKLTKNLVKFKKFSELYNQKFIPGNPGYEEYESILEKIGKLRSKTFVQGTVFEEYIYHLVVENFDFDEVWTGVKVMFEEGVENEFDVLMIKDNHLHTIECKLVNGLNGEHFVYKTELIKDYLDDDGKAMILSIGADNVRYTKSGNKKTQFTYGDKARANYGEIRIYQSREFDEKAFLDDVRGWFL